MKTTLPGYFAYGKIPGVILLLLCWELAFPQASALLKFGNSYVNLSKKTSGGPVQPGDTLEIRTNFYVRSNYNGTGMMYSLRYYDSLPTHTDTINDFIRLITNEGLTYKQFTLAPGDDAGSFVRACGAGNYQYRINMGDPAYGAASAPATMSLTNITGAGNIKGNKSKPLFSSGSIITTAFRVVVTGSYGDTIVLGGGKIVYKKSSGGADTTLNATPYKILIAKPSTLCSNSAGTNFAAEAGGTFDHGIGRNRSYGPTYLIPGYTYLPAADVPLNSNVIGDGYYAIVNNISPTSSTFPGANRQPACGAPVLPSPLACANREFGGFWFISGDHTGTTTAAGNNPPDANTDAGYMLLVNADLATSEAYRQTITGLCPNTYYQFSAWVKNVCPNCGIDSNSAATYKPGVLPNLTFVIDNLDRYSSGQLDTVGWQKRGFVFLTGPTQTSITISLRTNAPGGGGNDWALDDITLATCPPDLLLTPNRPDTLCQGADDTVRFKVASYVDNYTQWLLEKSTDGGLTWASPGNDTLGLAPSGTASPVYNPISGEYEALVTRYYRLNLVDTLVTYRITVATTVANLSAANCSFITSTPKVVRAVNCNIALPTSLVYFSGQLNDGLGALQWLSSNETPDVAFSVERSNNGSDFKVIGAVRGSAGAGMGAVYHFTDPAPVSAQTWYRINIISNNYNKYSNQVLLSNTGISFDIRNLLNPFTDHISIDLTSPGNGAAVISLIDIYGRSVRQERQAVSQGLDNLTLYGLGNLATGTYVLQIRYNDNLISRKVVKLVR